MLEIQDGNPEYGINTNAVNQTTIQTKLMDLLVVSGGYISTDRDELGNILLQPDPENPLVNKKLVTQWISVDLDRRDYDDVQLQKVFDTDINELYKLSKTKSTEELRVEMERLRRLLADAEAEITVVENVIVQDSGDGSGDGTGDGTGGGDGGGPDETTILANGDRLAPFTLDVEGYTINIQTAIWNTDTQRINPNEMNAAEQAINYSLQRDATGQVSITLRSKIANPAYFQGWFYDAENLGNTQNYNAIGGGDAVIHLSLTDERVENQGDSNNFTFALGYKDEAPPVVTLDPILVQTAEFLAHIDELTGKRDNISLPCTWVLTDSEGNLVRESSATTRNRDTGEFVTSRIVQTPFRLGVSPGQNLKITASRVGQILSGNGIEGWWNVSDNNVNTEILGDTRGARNNILEYRIPSDIKGILIAYDPT